MPDKPNAAKVLGYLPIILRPLDGTTRDMLLDLLDVIREGGYEDGFRDASQRAPADVYRAALDETERKVQEAEYHGHALRAALDDQAYCDVSLTQRKP